MPDDTYLTCRVCDEGMLFALTYRDGAVHQAVCLRCDHKEPVTEPERWEVLEGYDDDENLEGMMLRLARAPTELEGRVA